MQTNPAVINVRSSRRKVEGSKFESPKTSYALSSQDETPLTEQDKLLLALLKELDSQGYDIELINVGGRAAVVLPERIWR